MKSTGMTGVKQFLKPDAYKQSEPVSVIRSQTVLISDSDIWVTAYLLYNGSASWSS